MTQEQQLTRYETAPLAPVVTDTQIDLIKRTVASGATDQELQLYLYDCQRHNVHPLDKLLHFTKRGGKYTPITSIDLLRSRAADTGELGGIEDPQYRGEPVSMDFTASVTVYRFVQGQRCPFTATARWAEYKPGPGQDHMWNKMPYLMLGKCAEALALRKAFPRQIAGLYIREEMDQADTPAPQRPSGPASYTPVVDTSTPLGQPSRTPAPAPRAPEPVVDDVPMCEIHGTPMRVSKHGGHYCPQKDDAGKWCKGRAVKPARSIPDDWQSEYDAIDAPPADDPLL